MHLRAGLVRMGVAHVVLGWVWVWVGASVHTVGTVVHSAVDGLMTTVTYARMHVSAPERPQTDAACVSVCTVSRVHSCVCYM